MTAFQYDKEGFCKRRDKAWQVRRQWDPIYRAAYDYAMPYRRPSCDSKGDGRVDHLFDQTGVTSAFRGAGQMQQDLFPPGQVFFRLKPGPVTRLLAKSRAKARAATKAAANAQAAQMGHNGGPPIDDNDPEIVKFERQLDDVSDQITPFFLSGEFDNAMSELCLELYIGTGCMLVLQGDAQKPIRFVCLPVEEVALEPGPYGDVGGLFWKTKMSRRAIMEAFKKGTFSKQFQDAYKATPDEEIELHQDFVKDGDAGGWVMVVCCDDALDEPITVQKYKTQPFVASRFYRVPGEVMGRGPVLLALPTIKTLNKAMEITLKAAAIQMLGIWGYRPGGAFDPDTARLAPGEFWAMASTGGVMGADVQRLDPGGNVQLGNIILQELRTQVQISLHDESLPQGGGTPASASEIMARVARLKQNYVGAFGRMINEIVPVIIPRAIEILNAAGLITSQLAIDNLLVAIDVISPLAQALKADAHRTTVEAMQAVAALEGQQALARRFKIDEIMPMMIKDLGVKSKYVRDAIELTQYDAGQKQAVSQQQVQEAMLAQPDKFAEALSPNAGGAPQGATMQ